jgi:hypothetical protein
MFVANLALARSINYDRKVSCKLKCTFTIVTYDPKPFIVQVTGVMFTLSYWAHS